MKYEVKTEENGDVALKLGLNHGVTFQKGATAEDICAGVEALIEVVVGVSAFELAVAVVNEFAKDIPVEPEQVDEPANG